MSILIGKSRLQTLLIFLFLLMIWLPVIGMITGLGPKWKSTEKRKLSPFPTLQNFSPGKWTGEFNSYFNDNFGFRNLLIAANNRLFIKGFAMSPVPIVVIGKDGWLYYKSEATGDGPSISDYQGLSPLSYDQLKTISQDLSTINSRLAERGIMFMVLIGPNKSTIYGEYLPNSIKKVAPQTRFDQLKSFLSQNSEVSLLDSRKILSDSRKYLPTYYKTDTHWNDFSAFLVSRQIISALTDRFPVLIVPPLDNYNISVSSNSGHGDIATMLDAEGEFPDQKIDLVPKKKLTATRQAVLYPPDAGGYEFSTNIPPTPKVLILGDSYSGALEPFLPNYFSQSAFIGLGPTYHFRWDIIDKEKPNIVVWEVAERFIDRLHL